MTLTSRIIAVVRAKEADQAYEAAMAAARGGIQALEITYTTKGASEVIAALQKSLKAKDPAFEVGAGSIMTIAEAMEAQRAGASFAVSPHLDPVLVRWFKAEGLTYAPGCMTPSELVHAHQLGAPLQKLFPATVFGPSGVRTLLGPMPFLNLIVTGGVDIASATAWISAGARAVCIGSNVFTSDRIGRANWNAIEHDARLLVQAVHP